MFFDVQRCLLLSAGVVRLLLGVVFFDSSGFAVCEPPPPPHAQPPSSKKKKKKKKTEHLNIQYFCLTSCTAMKKVVERGVFCSMLAHDTAALQKQKNARCSLCRFKRNLADICHLGGTRKPHDAPLGVAA